MHITQHINTRMNLRGIRRCLVDLALELGEAEGDRYTLDRKAIDREIGHIKYRLKVLSDARKRGGVTVVAEGDTLITTYRTDSFSANAAKIGRS